MSPVSTRPFWIWLGRKVGIPKSWVRTDAERASTLRRSEGARRGWAKRKATLKGMRPDQSLPGVKWWKEASTITR